MKKLLGIILFVTAFALGADVKPFVFENVAADSATQQQEFEYMLKYKLFGRDYLEIGNEVRIPDKSGWNGTANDMTVTNYLKLGGATLVGGDIHLDDGNQFTTGPIRANSLTIRYDNGSYFGGTVVLANTPSQNVQDIITRSGGTYVSSSTEVPNAPTNLSMPIVDWNNLNQDTTLNDIDISYNNNLTATINVPDGEGTYDIFINSIKLCKQTNTSGSSFDGCKLYVNMPDGGRLTRIFVRDLVIGNHTTIQVVYRTDEGDVIQGQSQYRGNLMFYTDSDIVFERTDNYPIQGTYISTNRIYLACNLDFAGQLLGNQLKIGDQMKGENFKFVPFDPDTLDIDPELNKNGGLRENDSTVIIPIQLSDTATVDVYFNYCFDLKDGVSIEDFNLVTDFPICGQNTKTVMIPTGKKTPLDTIKINVKKDTIIEPNDWLIMKISIESGAVLPNNKTEGELKIKIIDADLNKHVEFDTTATYSFEENKTGVVDLIKVLNKTDSTKFILDSAFAGRYTLNENTGELTLVNNPLDYENASVDYIKVKLTDTNDVEVVRVIPISVIDVNEAPVVRDTTITVPENLKTNDVVGQIIAKDPDINPAFSTLSYSILTNDVPFTIDNTGKVTVTDSSRINYEKDSVFTFNVRVTDGVLADTATVIIKLTNIKENPHIIDDGKKNYDVDENEWTDFVIATIKVVDEDIGQIDFLKFDIKNTTGADSLFKYTYKVVNDTGNIIISVKDQAKLDYEKINPVQALNIVVTDTEGMKDSIQKTITVKDINEAPVLNDTTITLLENLPIPSIVGTLKATDQDTAAVYRQNIFELLSGSEYFGVNNSGIITATKIFNYESDDSVYTLKVIVKDKNTPSLADTATVTIKIGNTNEGPKFPTNDTTFFVDENTAPGIVGSIPAYDDDGDKIKYIVIGTDLFTVDSLGNVISKREFDYETETGFSFKVVASDGTLTDTVKVNVKVNNVNEECTVSDTTFSIDENATGKVGTVNATDKDKDAIFGTITYDISDPVNYQIDKDGNVFVKNPLNYEDTKFDTLKVYITDGTFKDTGTVIIKVNNVPEDIVISGTINPVEENVEIGTPVGVIKGLDGDSTVVTYTIDTQDFKIDQVTGVITTNSNIDYETLKEYTVTVTATSTDGSKKDTVIVIPVINVNEPVHVDDAAFDVEENYVGPIGTIKGEDEDGEPVQYTIRDSNDYSVDSLGNITINKPLDYEKQKTDTLIVDVTTPSGDRDSAIIIINVKNVNEDPVLQPNDSLTVPENCKNCTIGIITAIDPDNDPIIYEVIESGFTIDSTGTLKITDPVDYEKTKEIPITVIAKDTNGAADTLAYIVKVTDINEPVHVQDTTCSVKENYTGDVCQIKATDEDGTKPTYTLLDTTDYKIDTNGVLIIKNPIDFEKKTMDTVTVIVTDGTYFDTAQVVINVLDEIEKVEITSFDDKPKQDTVRTNNPDHVFEWQVCEQKDCIVNKEYPAVHKDTVIKVCNVKKTVCDSVVVLFNDAPPVVTLTNATSTTATIDYITIEEEKDKDKIYVNKKDNELTVTVKDTVNHTSKSFDIGVKLDTVHVSSKNVQDYNYIIDEMKAEIVPIGAGLAEMKEVIKDKDTGTKVIISKIVNLETKEPIDTVQTVTYTKKQGDKEITVSYKTDNLTGERLTNYVVSYHTDSCTTVSFELGDNKKIVKNEEGNIGYTITYEYTDDYGNKASSKVDIIFDDIPPVVKIISPIKGDIFKTNAIEVKWEINGIAQDTLTLQRLEKGANVVIRRYVDKAGNVAADTVAVIMKEAKDIDISIVYPVTEINQDKVDSFYSEGHKYNPEKPFTVKTLKNDETPDPIGVGFQIDLALPSVSPTGGLASLDDVVKNGMIPIDDKGNIVGASTRGIPVDEYVKEHCTEEFQKDYKKNGLNIPLYDVKYTLHLWIYTTQANYVNDFDISYTLNDEDEASAAGTVTMVVDYIADRDGHVKAFNGHALGTSSYITKLFSKSVAKHRCDYKEQRKGEKTIRKEQDMTVFGYKRPIKK